MCRFQGKHLVLENKIKNNVFIWTSARTNVTDIAVWHHKFKIFTSNNFKSIDLIYSHLNYFFNKTIQTVPMSSFQ